MNTLDPPFIGSAITSIPTHAANPGIPKMVKLVMSKLTKLALASYHASEYHILHAIPSFYPIRKRHTLPSKLRYSGNGIPAFGSTFLSIWDGTTQYSAKDVEGQITMSPSL